MSCIVRPPLRGGPFRNGLVCVGTLDSSSCAPQNDERGGIRHNNKGRGPQNDERGAYCQSEPPNCHSESQLSFRIPNCHSE